MALTIAQIEAIAVDKAQVTIDAAAAPRMRKGRAVVETYLKDKIPAYGLTTGLGVRVGDMLPDSALADFSARLVRGRAQGVGEPLTESAVRAVMAVRLNTMLTGATGQSEGLAEFIAEALNRGFHPVMPRQASIGAADLVAMAALAAGLVGEGEALRDGKRVPAAAALSRLGLEPFKLKPRDGHILCNNTAFSVGQAALAAGAAQRLLKSHVVAAALAFEGFRGNASPFGADILALRPQAGVKEAGADLRRLLDGGLLLAEGQARRLQDPLSFRCMAQVFGAAYAQLAQFAVAVGVELNAAPENPAVLAEAGKILTTGNFHLTQLAATADGFARSLAWTATDGVSRIARLLSPPFSGLPPLLSSDAAERAGFGPLMKPAEALRADIIHQATPVPVLPSHNADGQEDALTLAPLAVAKLAALLQSYELLIAIELVAGAQAVDLAKPARVAPRLAEAHRAVRALSPFIADDRPLGADIERIAATLVGSGALVAATGLHL
jgi:histidine ammonia-lyase